ncbi:MAG: hypothetical protein IJA95_03710 [Bacteroidaceae bacterium]|nr:hypothetical protein [Bacteroidaceae bacterium]
MKEKLLLNSIEIVLDKKFLLSKEFKKLIIKLNMDDLWESSIKRAEESRSLFTLDDWGEKHDSWCAFQDCVKSQNPINKKIIFVSSVLKEYVIYSSRSISVTNIKDCFSLMGATDEDLSLLDSISCEVTMEMINIDNVIEHSEFAHKLYAKMNEEFYNSNYESCNTYSFTLLEGIFKIYLKYHQIQFDNRRDDIKKMATLIREDIKTNRMENNLLDESNALKQISTIADIIDRCRNRASVSHFDSNSDMITTGFIKDLSISVANMLIRIIKRP